MRIIIQDKDGYTRLVAIGNIAPTLTCFLAGALLGSLITLLATP